jgi:hypothetical protein
VALSVELSAGRQQEVVDQVTPRLPSLWPHSPNSLWVPLLAFLCVCLVPSERLHAQQDERAVRAAYVFSLTKYVVWPNRRNQLVIGVVGDGDMGPILKQVLDGKKSDGKDIRIAIHPSEAELHDCDILYVADSSPAEIHSILHRIGGRSVLTVGETDRFVRAGGMVAMVRSGDQMQIEVNLTELRTAQLQMSSRLLRLAVIVTGDGGAP